MRIEDGAALRAAMICGVVALFSNAVHGMPSMERVERSQWAGDAATLEAIWEQLSREQPTQQKTNQQKSTQQEFSGEELGVLSEVDLGDVRRIRFERAFVAWRINYALHGQSDTEADRNRWLEAARIDLDWLLERDAADVPALVVHCAVMGELAGHAGWFARISLGRAAMASIERAYGLAPDDPRVALQRGILRFHTPSFAGGGAGPAIAELERAIALYDAGRESEPWPAWGRLDTYAWLGQALAEVGRVEEARAVFDRALAYAPTSGWIRHVLLPGLPP